METVYRERELAISMIGHEGALVVGACSFIVFLGSGGPLSFLDGTARLYGLNKSFEFAISRLRFGLSFNGEQEIAGAGREQAGVSKDLCKAST